MKGWKRFSLYHVIQNRLDNKFIKHTWVDFFSHVTNYSEFGTAIWLATTIISFALHWYMGWTILTWLIVDWLMYGFCTFIVAIVDTYATYKYRIRQQGQKSIKRILNVL